MNRSGILTAVTAAVVTLAGCAPTQPPAAQPPASPVAPATATPVAASSAPWVHAADHRWQKLPTIAGDPLPPGSGLQAGSTIVQRLADGGLERCTAGAGFDTPGGGEVIGAVGHCDREAGRPVYRDGEPSTTALGTYTDRIGGQVPGLGPDLAWLSLDAGQQLSPDVGRIAGRWPVIGVMPADDIQQLPAGTSVCAMTGSAGPRCGELGYTRGRVAALEFKGFSPIRSDSGSVVFLVTEDGYAVLLGGLGAQIPLGSASPVTRQTFTYYDEKDPQRPLLPILGGGRAPNRT